MAQKDQAAADTWLKETQAGQALVGQFTAIATRINAPETTITVASPPLVPSRSDRPPSANVPIQGWIGIATPAGGVQPDDWYSGTDTLTLPTGQQWYQIQVHRGWVNGQWQPLAAERSPAALWERLGSPPTLQLLTPEGATAGTSITVIAIQQQGNQVQLLGTGPPNPENSRGSWLAISPGQFRRFDNLPQQPFTLVYQRYPEALATLGELLGLGNLEAAAAISAGPLPGQDLTVQLQDVTGDGQAEIILSPEGRSTVIVNGQGQILWQGGAVLLGGLVNADGSHLLVARLGGQYRFHGWSAPGQKFE